MRTWIQLHGEGVYDMVMCSFCQDWVQIKNMNDHWCLDALDLKFK